MKMSYADAIRDGLIVAMEKDPAVVVYGIGVPDHKGAFGTTLGLAERFGKDRCFDTPLSEAGMTGVGIGMALAGLRPVHVHLRADFLLLAMDQLVNMAASHNFISGRPVPLVIRAVVGRGWGQGCHHSKSLEGMLCGVPGIKVVAPVTPRQAKGLLLGALSDGNPTVILEHRWLYWAEDEVPEGYYADEIGYDRVVREGSDVTIVATSWMVVEALRAADILARVGVSVEVVDAVTLNPYNGECAVESIKKTKVCFVAGNDWLGGGWAGEAAAWLNMRGFVDLQFPITRLGWAPCPCPTERRLEETFYGGAKELVELVCLVGGLDCPEVGREELYSHERKFRGPF